MKKYIMIASALLLLAAGCTKEDVRDVSEDTSVSFSFIKYRDPFAVTRAPGDEIANGDEWFIDGLDVYSALGGTVSLLEENKDYTIATTGREYTITMSLDWIADHAAQLVNFYFVGNDTISAYAGEAIGDNIVGHDALRTSDEADFRNALTNALGIVGEKLDTIPHPDATGGERGLLFSSVIEDVRITGKVQASGQLRRREARFDIENPMPGTFQISEILVSNASTAGMIFPVGEAALLAGVEKRSHVSIPGPQKADYNDDSVATSVFYLYPTTLGTGDELTNIVVMGKLADTEVRPYPVTVSVSRNQVQANMRYVLRLIPASMTFNLTVEDWAPGDTADVLPTENETLVLRNFAATAPTAWMETGYHYEFDGTTGQTLTFDVTTEYGTEASVEYVLGGVPTIADVAVQKTKNVLVTYASTRVEESYEITVPASAASHLLHVNIRSKNSGNTVVEGAPSVTIVFTRLWGGYADILYFADDGTLQIGQWGDEITPANYRTKMAFFQFGSVVGFTNDAATWDASEVKFDPSSGTHTDYTLIPKYDGTTDWPGVTNISDTAAYHTLANVKLGKGDPCRLVGLTAAEIAAMSDNVELYANNAGWRLPTIRENTAFVGGPAAATWDGTTNYNYTTSGWNGGQGDANTVNKGNPYDFYTTGSPSVAAFPVTAGYAPANSLTLPAVSYRNNTTGAVVNQGPNGRWWSSTLTNATEGRHLNFYHNRVFPTASYSYSTGFAIRCVNPSLAEVPAGVKPDEAKIPVVPIDPNKPLLGSNDIMYLDASGKLALGKWGDAAMTLDNILFFKFGSIVGVDNNEANDTPWGGNADVLFDPTSGDYTDWTEIPFYTSDHGEGTGWRNLGQTSAEKIRYSRKVSDAGYHTFINIKAGKGDACQLIGLTAAQIAGAENAAELIALLDARPAEAKGWRLPTALENRDFAGGNTTWQWGDANYTFTTASGYFFYAAGTPAIATIGGVGLPATGWRVSTAGVVTAQDVNGYWWSSTPASATNGHNLRFNSSNMTSVNSLAYSSGMAVRCVKDESLPVVSTAHTPGDANGILYFDSDKLAVGTWGTELTAANYLSRLAFFKFGSIIGFNNVDAWSFDDIKFNPTPLTDTEITAYSTDPYDAATSNALPRVPGFVKQDWDRGVRDVSAVDYHTFTNIKAGKGDPCQLIGLTAEQIRRTTGPAALKTLLDARPAAQKGWRLPTTLENKDFVGGPAAATWDGTANYNYTTSANNGGQGDANSVNPGNPYDFFTANSGNASNPGLGKFPVVTDGAIAANSQTLPAAGYRNTTTGAVTSQGTSGLWWSSTPYSGSHGHNLTFDSTNVHPVTSSYSAYGFSVRCVKPAS